MIVIGDSLCAGCGGSLGADPITVHSLPGGLVATHPECSVDERSLIVTISASMPTGESDDVQRKLDAGWILLGHEQPLSNRPDLKAVYVIPPLDRG